MFPRNSYRFWLFPYARRVFLGRLENEFSSHAWSSIPALINLFDSEKKRIDR